MGTPHTIPAAWLKPTADYVYSRDEPPGGDDPLGGIQPAGWTNLEDEL